MFITVAQATAAYTGLKALFNKGFMPTDATIADMWKLVAMIAPSDTEEEEYGWLKNLSSIREWVGDRVLQSLVEANYKIKNKHFEGTIAVPVDKIADRKLGGYGIAAEQLGQNARNFPNRLVFPLLAAGWTTIGLDGQYFFDNNHPVQNPDGTVTLVSNNGGGAGTAWYLLDTTKVVKPLIYQPREEFKPSALVSSDSDHVFKRNELLFGVDGRCNVGFGLWQCAYGSKQPLTAANIWAARAQMASIKGDNGEPLGITPNMLLVSPANEQGAREALQAVILNNTSNVLAGTMTPVVCPWLS
jgi:phage major head subunit gpT-like protein